MKKKSSRFQMQCKMFLTLHSKYGRQWREKHNFCIILIPSLLRTLSFMTYPQLSTYPVSSIFLIPGKILWNEQGFSRAYLHLNSAKLPSSRRNSDCLLFNGVSTFSGYLMPNPSFLKGQQLSILPIDGHLSKCERNSATGVRTRLLQFRSPVL